MPSEPLDPDEETGENQKAEPEAPPSGAKRAFPKIKRPKPLFLDELDENPRLARRDKRYASYWKQLTWLGIVALVTAGGIVYLILRYEKEKIDPVPSPDAQAKSAAITQEHAATAQPADDRPDRSGKNGRGPGDASHP